MLNVLSRYWWVLALRGVIAIIFAILVFLSPGIALVTLVLFFGAYALVDGVLTVIASLRDRDSNRHWWVLLLEGVVGIIAGILTFIWPGITSLVLLYMVAAWAILTGIFEIISAIRLREEIEGELWLGLSGLASLVFGVLLVVIPAPAGLLTLVWLVGIYALVFGVIMIILAFRVRGLRDEDRPRAHA